jgi:hypothetical protein
MVVMVNDTVIKATLTPMDEGGFPYDYFPWQRRQGMPWGRGIARQVRTPQRMLNAAVRSMMDNAGLTSGPIFAVRRKWIEPITGSWNLTPRMGFYMTDAAPDAAKIQDAISFENIQSNVNEVNLIIDKALKFAEDATGLPMLMQGQQGSAPDTVGGMTILNNNGSTVLRRLARNFDDYVTERHIRRYYYWLLNDPNVPDTAKGDFQIDARGSTALVERDLQNQALNMMIPTLMQHPDAHPTRIGEEWVKANRLDPKRFFMTEAEKAQRPPPPPPLPILVQQERNKGAMELQNAKGQLEAGLQERELTAREAEAMNETERFIGEMALRHQISADTLKQRLFDTTAKLNVQVQVSEADRAQQALTPPTEPEGRAPNGKGFTK